MGKLAIQLTTPLLLHKPCKHFASVVRVCQRQLGFLGTVHFGYVQQHIGLTGVGSEVQSPVSQSVSKPKKISENWEVELWNKEAEARSRPNA